MKTESLIHEFIERKKGHWSEAKYEKIETYFEFFESILKRDFENLQYKDLLRLFQKQTDLQVFKFRGYKSVICEKRFFNELLDFYRKRYEPRFGIGLYENFDNDLDAYRRKKKYKSSQTRIRFKLEKPIKVKKGINKKYKNQKLKRKKERLLRDKKESLDRIQNVRRILGKER